MPHNIITMKEFYNWLTNIGSLKFREKSVLIIGGSDMVVEYLSALSRLGVKNITVIAKTGKKVADFCNKFQAKLLIGGFEKHLQSIQLFDLVIVAPPLHLTIDATKLLIENGQNNILIEKPGSLYKEELLSLASQKSSQEIRVGYNRLVYPNLHKLKELVEDDEGITSCRFTFTERVSKIDFKKDIPKVYQRWGISNSLHVITMAFNLVGNPKEIYPHQYGSLEWHPTGSIFIGTGISEKDIPFSYHADWGSGGRWGIEVNTKKNSYQLIPLEELYVCPRDTGTWNKVSFEKTFPDVKQGMAEEVAIMLERDNKHKSMLPTLKAAAGFNKFAEKIFDYT